MKSFALITALLIHVTAGAAWTKDCAKALKAQVDSAQAFTPLKRVDGETEAARSITLLVRMKGEGQKLKLPSFTDLRVLSELRFEKDGNSYEVLSGPALELAARRKEIAFLNRGATIDYQVIDVERAKDVKPTLKAELRRRLPALGWIGRPFGAIDTVLARSKFYARKTDRLAARLHQRRNPAVTVPLNLRREVQVMVDPASGPIDVREDRLMKAFGALTSTPLDQPHGLTDAVKAVAKIVCPERFAQTDREIPGLNLEWRPHEMARDQRLMVLAKAWRYVDGLVFNRGMEYREFNAAAVEATLAKLNEFILNPTRIEPTMIPVERLNDARQLFAAEFRHLRDRRPINLIIDREENLTWTVVEGRAARDFGVPGARVEPFKVSFEVLEQFSRGEGKTAPILMRDLVDEPAHGMDILRKAAFDQRALKVQSDASEFDFVWILPAEVEVDVAFALEDDALAQRDVLTSDLRRNLKRDLLSTEAGQRHATVWVRPDGTAAKVTYAFQHEAGERARLTVLEVSDATRADLKAGLGELTEDLQYGDEKVSVGGLHLKGNVIKSLTVPADVRALGLMSGASRRQMNSVVNELRDMPPVELDPSTLSFFLGEGARRVALTLGNRTKHWAQVKRITPAPQED